MTLYVFTDWITNEMAIFSSEKKRKDFFRKWAHSLEEWPDEYEDYTFQDIELDKEFSVE